MSQPSYRLGTLPKKNRLKRRYYQSMAILLLISSFISLFLIFLFCSTEKEGLRSSFIKTCLLHGLIIAVSTEMLSAVAAFHINFIIGLWASIFFISAFVLLYIIKTQPGRHQDCLSSLYHLSKKYQSLDAIDRICIITLGAILSITLVSALFSPPNNLDSMSYHMPRVMHWIQNASISHYPTNNVRQISFPPGAEYAVAQMMLLSGNDYFSNIIQWISFLGCILGVSLIAANFTDRKGQILSALFCATIPMAILQSGTTQTDLVVAFLLVSCAYFIFRSKFYSWVDLAWISLSFGLAILTKPTSYFFGFPLGLMLIFRYAFALNQRQKFSSVIPKTIVLICCIGISSIFLSIPSYYRNFNTFGNYLGPDSGTRSSLIGLKPMVSNLTRNIALNLPLPDYWRWVEKVHETILGLDVDDERTTFKGNMFSKCPEWLFLLPDEDFAGNPLHLLLIVFTTGAIILRRSIKQDQNMNGLILIILTVTSGVFIYNLLIKWQIWGNRLHLPAIILMAPIAGSVMARSRRSLMVLLVLVFLFQGAVYSLFAIRHPLISLKGLGSPIFNSDSIFQTSRENLYFNGNFEYMLKPIQEMKQKIENEKCRAIGITLARPEFEYAVWTVLNNGTHDKIKIKHVDVDNESKKLSQEFSDESMCAVADVEMKKIKYKRYQ